MRKRNRWLAMAVVAGSLFTGCAAAGTGVPGSRSSVVHGEVRSVDTRASRIQLREERGRTVNVRYDGRTTVVYRQRRYPVSALERGDRVMVRLASDSRGRSVASRIDVRENVRERGRAGGRVQRVDGAVSWVDTRGRAFGLSVTRGPNIVVDARRELSRSDRARFERLRRGDRVRADVRAIGRDRYELVRFR